MKEIISKYLKEHGFGEFTPRAVLFDMDGTPTCMLQKELEALTPSR